MSGYLFDASALSAYLNEGHKFHATACDVINALPTGAAKFVSLITLGELEYGIRLAELNGSGRLTEYRERLETIRQYASLDITQFTSHSYAELKAGLAASMRRKPRQKMPRWVEDWVLSGSAKQLQIDENDLWLCAQAKERDLTVVTGDIDLRHLSNVDSDLSILLTQP